MNNDTTYTLLVRSEEKGRSIMETAVQTYYVIPTDSPFRSLTSMAMSGWEFKSEQEGSDLFGEFRKLSPKRQGFQCGCVFG